MENNQYFEIRYGALTNYTGPGGDVTIPAGVTEIGWDAFHGCTNLISVTIPAGVTKIGDWAFFDCAGLTSVVIPEGVKEIGKCAFYSCTGLTSVTIPASVTEIRDRAFYGCAGLTSVTIPASVTEIGDGAFYGCTGLTEILVDTNNSIYRSEDGMLLKKEYLLICPRGKTGSVTIPAGVTKIGECAFLGCGGLTSVTIPEGVTEIGERAFSGCVDLPRSIRKIEIGRGDEERYKTMPDGLARTADKLSDGIAELINVVWHQQMTTEDWAGLYLFQTSKAFQELFKKRMKAPADEYLSAMLALLADCKKGSAYVQAANYVVEHLKDVSPEHVQELYEMAAAKKSFQKAADILKPLVSPRKKKAAAPDGPFAFLEDTFQEEQLLKHYKEQKGVLARLGKVLLADGSGNKAPKLAVLAAVMPYADEYIKPTRANGHKQTEVQFLPESDRAAALLDHESLMELLWANAKSLDSFAWLLPYCRFANGKEIQTLLAKRKEWGDWGRYNKKGRDAQEFLDQCALMLSDTREAMLYLEKVKDWKGTRLDDYARLRGTNVETLWATVLVDFGLDSAGKKVYDLGGNTVTVSLAQDLTLSLFDETTRKTVKSIPKKGSDPEKYEAAKADLAEMKKNVKKVAKARCDALFQAFLSGSTFQADSWKASYAGENPLLRQVASLLVWSQDGKTFTLRDGAAIDSGEQDYAIGDAPIQVAHPMEMKSGDVAAWQKYFNNHGIKQPFAQVWEPVVRPETLREDLYSGIQIPAYRFKGQEKHGISFQYDYGSSVGNVSFAGCSLDFDPGDAMGRHALNLDGLFTLGRFTFKTYTRQVNHIVSLLDKWTIIGRIMRDDASIVAHLDSATLAQVMQYLDFAIENGRTNVTAELLNYKNEHFPDFDPLAAFTLEDL